MKEIIEFAQKNNIEIKQEKDIVTAEYACITNELIGFQIKGKKDNFAKKLNYYFKKLKHN